MNLFRGSEYQRFTWATGKEPLTYYDMNLSAQDHQTFFTCEHDAGKQEYEGGLCLVLSFENPGVIQTLMKRGFGYFAGIVSKGFMYLEEIF